MKKKMYLILFVLLISSAYVMAQVRVSGTVKDADGLALPGVSVVQVGTTVGTTTDLNGSFSLNATSANAVLRFTFVGMTAIEEPLNGRTTINVTMQSESIGLQEVVVTALGYHARKENTYLCFATSFDAKDIKVAANNNFMEGLSR